MEGRDPRKCQTDPISEQGDREGAASSMFIHLTSDSDQCHNRKDGGDQSDPPLAPPLPSLWVQSCSCLTRMFPRESCEQNCSMTR